MASHCIDPIVLELIKLHQYDQYALKIAAANACTYKLTSDYFVFLCVFFPVYLITTFISWGQSQSHIQLLYLPHQTPWRGYAMMSIAHAQCAVEAMLDLHWNRARIFWRRMFFLKYLFSHIVGVRQPCATGAVTGRGYDELQCRPVPAESAGGFRADPEDRKRHIRRCVQGKTAVREALAEFHCRTRIG